MLPLVSVIVPVYNSGLYLKECVESVIAQTYSNIEIIVVDDGSTDGCTDFLRKSNTVYPNLIFVSQKNSGACAARNLGIRNARGTYIQFLDADDCLSPEKIERQISHLKSKSEFCVSFCEFVIFRNSTCGLNSVYRSVFRDFNSGVDLLLHLWNNHQFIANNSYIISKSLMDKAGYWDESLILNQDGEFFARVLSHSEEVYFVPQGRAFYRKPEVNNVSRQKSERAFVSLLNSYRSYERNILSVEDSIRVRKAIKKVYLKFIYDCFPNFPHLISESKNLMVDLGVSDKVFIGGPTFQFITKIFGFKNALRLKRFFQ